MIYFQNTIYDFLFDFNDNKMNVTNLYKSKEYFDSIEKIIFLSKRILFSKHLSIYQQRTLD